MFIIATAELSFPEFDIWQICLCDLEGLRSYGLEGKSCSTHSQEWGSGIKAELCVLNGLFEAAVAEKAKYCSSLPLSEEKPAQHSSLEVTWAEVEKLNTILWNMLLLASSCFCWVTLFVTEALIGKLHSACW